MSVLLKHRTESKAEYVNTANEIYKETIRFLTKLSSRYSRLLSEKTAQLASEVVSNAEKANSIFPSPNDVQKKELRKAHLLEARAALMALDVQLAHCYDIMMLNPQGCFTTSTGNTVDKSRAVQKLDKMSQSLGEKIDKEDTLLKAVLKSDKTR